MRTRCIAERRGHTRVRVDGNPYGELPDRFVKDMTVQEMHDFLKGRRGWRQAFKGAMFVGLAAVSGPILRRRSYFFSPTADAPQWIAYGADPTRQIYLSWSLGTHDGPVQVPPAPQVRWGVDQSYGGIEHAYLSGPVPVPVAPAAPTQNTIYNHAFLDDLSPNTTYHYSVSNDGVNWGPDATFTTADSGCGRSTPPRTARQSRPSPSRRSWTPSH
jgi:Purple acid Phosphatase, N-terminal domain